MLTRYVALIPLIVLTSIGESAAAADTDAEADEQTLREARLPSDGSSLLAVFRKRTPDADSQARIKTLIGQLGSDSYTEREEASEELASFGVEATGLLRAAIHHDDLEIRRRSRDALTIIEQNDLSTDVLIAALRVLSRRKPPPRLTDVLLEYVPFAANPDVAEEVCLALASVAMRDGKADPRLLGALTATSPIQRAIAGAALCRGGGRNQLPAVRRLLRDSDPHVRGRVALALLVARDKASVPVLIELLSDLPLAEAEHVESMLLQLAGDSAPKGSLEEGRGKYRDAWTDWWRRRGDALDLAKIDLVPHWRGFTLAICMTAIRGRGARAGTILEVDAKGKTRWQIQGLFRPVDAQVLDEKRVLVTEYSPGQVTERNLNGDVLRRISVSDTPLEARRLPNGNTLITTRSRVYEIDRNDKEVWVTDSRGDLIVAACSFRGGEVGICYQSGEFVRVDRKGEVLTSFRVGRAFRPYGTHIQGLPNGHVLVPLYYENKVVEFDRNGREVWSVRFAQPASAQRLPNGRTLVTGYASNTIVELDKTGREVKSIPCLGRLMCVSGR
jgi:hypothetical protein